MKRTTATGAVAGLHVDRVIGINDGSLGIAEDRNNYQEEICSVIEGAGATLDGADWMQLEKAIIAHSHVVGEILDAMLELTPVGWASARSKTNPTNPGYLPVLPIWDADHDITSTAYPDLVTALRAQKGKSSNGAGAWVTDHNVTVAAHVVTGSGTAWDYLLAALAEDQLVDASAATTAGGWGMGKGAYTNWRCLNVGGTDYAITNVNVGAHTVTITGDSLSGAQTAIAYPYRIAGAATSARVFRVSGEVSVAAGWQEGVGGYRRRDRLQGHWHILTLKDVDGADHWARTTTAAATAHPDNTEGPSPDGVNGTPRTGGTTDARSVVRYFYVWAGRYIA